MYASRERFCESVHMVVRVQIYRVLGECLLISSLPGKALRMLADVARLAKRFNMRSQSEAG